MKILYKIEFLFYFYFGKFVTKNRAFGNNTIFLQQFFRFRGKISPIPPPPGYALGSDKFVSFTFRSKNRDKRRTEKPVIFHAPKLYASQNSYFFDFLQ